MNITKREKEVVSKLTLGLTTKEIANALCLSPHTVESHKKNLFVKLNARSLAQLGAIAVRSGIVVGLILCISLRSLCQSTFEIDGMIKSTNLSGEGDRMLMANSAGELITNQSAPGVFEICDADGNVIFKWDANQNLILQKNNNGDTLDLISIEDVIIQQEIAEVKKPNLKMRMASDKDKDFFDQLHIQLAFARNQMSGEGLLDIPDHFNQYPQTVSKQLKDGAERIEFVIGNTKYTVLLLNDMIINAVLLTPDGYIAISFNGSNIPFIMSFPLFDFSKLGTLSFDENSDLIKGFNESKLWFNDIENNSSLKLDGKYLTSTATQQDANGQKSLIGAHFQAVQDDVDQSFSQKDAVGVNKLSNNTFTITQLKKDALVFRELDIPMNLTTEMSIEFDPDDLKAIFCGGDLEVKGQIFSDGPMMANQAFVKKIFKSDKKLIAENIISGKINTDANGQAVVKVPEAVEESYEDFRYQLTPIGTFSQVIIKKELKSGVMVVMTDQPNVTVSWQILGVPIEKEREDIPREREIPYDRFLTRRFSGLD